MPMRIEGVLLRSLADEFFDEFMLKFFTFFTRNLMKETMDEFLSEDAV